ncbi:uncharacterized protein M437DRAFT_51366 [Aureobasidium melanogenum CBS 110374]|uniref:TATA element modulatory factor 1 TATA binding domain-containing protein n=1 Tax=Aureobasidium melanogenum (strain CBS 110374) TaxID=1043003 RepID=A0A074VVH6_AURM1|nr:uncharacterized protein M437DRAFT_51366 [Aureobasidium melanogenum CBS 110374]KEQ61727.1 hypothetical protein M437DRAFT_51366 [Aureobasidium melanogenum CBS 110374]
MASQPPNKPKASRWGSLLSGAVAGLESRLDTILAEDNEASARSRAQDKAAAQEKSSAEKPTALAVPNASADTSRSPSRSRLNDRLQERLAKAVASQNPSRSSTPLNQPASPRSSLGSRQSADIPRPLPEAKDEIVTTPSAEVPVLDVSTPDAVDEPVPESSAADPTPELVVTEPLPTLLTSGLPINPARISNDSQTRPSIDLNDEPKSEEKEPEVVAPKEASELNTELAQLRQENAEAEKQRQEEMLANLERIDALQAKLQYLAKETVAAAKEANSSSQATPQERKLAEKDERIALLMQEGEKLSKVEMRQGATIKKMRLKTQQDEKAMADLRKRLARLEDSESDLKQRLKRSEQIEKQSAERLKQYSNLEKDVENRKSELASSNATIASLRSQLLEAERKTEEAENKAKESVVHADANKLSAVQEQLEDAKLEKKLADDKWSAEVKRITEEARQQRQQASFRESELTNEISNYESRLEALRVRAEEASSDVGGDSQAKLLRQIETLQTQYSLAAENWRSIETSLNSRIAAIEKERDEAVKREADVRKKARDISSKAKRLEEQLEEMTEESQLLTSQLQASKTEMKKLQTRLETAETSLNEAKADLDRQKQTFESELSQKLEEERTRQLAQGLGIASPHNGTMASRTESPTSYFRKQPSQDPYGSVQSRRGLSRIPSQEQTTSLSIDRSVSRRPSTLAPGLMSSRTPMTPDFPSPSVSRQGSMFSLAQLLNGGNGAPQTPSIHTNDVDADDNFDNRSSPQRTINDVISASTVHTGPSVQLVQHMSSKIQRLEAEKSAHKDELARLVTQRDEARDEVVSMMREVEIKRSVDGKTDKLEQELGQVKQRYEACLEMLGEKEEEVEELKSDLVEVKKMYRELVDRNMK